MDERYQWLLFDADGTLFDYDRAEASALEEAFRQFGVPFNSDGLAAYRRINQQLWRAWEQGQITPDVLAVRRFERLFEEIRVSVSPELFSMAYTECLATCSELNDGAYEVLQALHGKYRLAILTNGLKAVQRPRLARSVIRDYIAALIISEEVGAAKPDRAIFDAAIARMGYPPRSAVLMIGDSLTADIQGAIHYGLDTCWYNPARQPRPPDLEITYEIAHLSELICLLG
jgi:YjjG family noncanonical pyrimidine nucleotidase